MTDSTMTLMGLFLLILVLALVLLGVLGRYYIGGRKSISGDHGDSMPIGEMHENQKMVKL